MGSKAALPTKAQRIARQIFVTEFARMIRIAITPAAFEAIAATLALGTVAVEPKRAQGGSVHIWLDPDALGPNQKQGGPIRPPEVGCPTGRPGGFELHWTAGGRPLAVRGAVGVCLGRNDVARASRCDWLRGLGSRRSKSLMPERNEPVIVTVLLNDLSECWCRKSKQSGGQSNLRLSHAFQDRKSVV